MSSVLVPILIAFFIGYQLDEVKLKKYDMVDQSGEVLKVQFSKNNTYACPLSCNLNHYHYAKNIDENSDVSKNWSILIDKNVDGLVQYNINGYLINSYEAIKVDRVPKNTPPVAFNDITGNK